MPDVVAATIGAAAGIGGTLLTIFQDQIRTRFGPKLKHLEGRWEGTGNDIKVDGITSFQSPNCYIVELDLTCRGGQLQGAGVIKTHGPDEDRNMRCTVEKIRVSGDFMSWQYKVPDIDPGHVGHALVEVFADREMRGLFLSKKTLEHTIGFGSIILMKTT